METSFFLRHRTVFIVNYTAFVIFCVLAVHSTLFTPRYDLPFQVWVESIRSASLTPLMLALTNIFQPAVFILITIVVSAILYYKKEKIQTFFFLFSVTGAVIFETILKDIFKVARPLNSLIAETGWSFPSGHATAVAVFTFMIFYFVKRNFQKKSATTLLFLASCLLVALVSFSRVYLGVHHLSDVLGGIALGIFWATFGILLLEKRLGNNINGKVEVING